MLSIVILCYLLLVFFQCLLLLLYDFSYLDYKMVITVVDDCSVIVITTLCSHCYGLFQSLLSTVTKGTYNYDDDDYYYYCHWF